MLPWDEFAWGSQSLTQIWRSKEQRNASLAVKYEASSGVGADYRWERLAFPVPRILRRLGQLHERLWGNCISKFGEIEGKALVGNIATSRAHAGRSQSENDQFSQIDGTEGQDKEAHFFEALWGGRATPALVLKDGARRGWDCTRDPRRQHWEARGTNEIEVAAGSFSTLKTYSAWQKWVA